MHREVFVLFCCLLCLGLVGRKHSQHCFIIIIIIAQLAHWDSGDLPLLSLPFLAEPERQSGPAQSLKAHGEEPRNSQRRLPTSRKFWSNKVTGACPKQP